MTLTISQIQELASLRSASSGTSLVTIYVPSLTNMTLVSNMINKELSTASNIKDKSVRKNVHTALKSCSSFLKTTKISIAPESGLMLLSGKTEYCL